MRLTVTDLVGKPGTSRTVVRSLSRAEATGVDLEAEPATAEGFGWGPADDALVWPIDLDVSLDSVFEGILVRGVIDYVADLPCARCLEPVREDRSTEVAELYRPSDDPEVEEGYEIVEDVLDLEILLRDAIVMDLPVRVLCDADCPGLCPTCGAHRGTEDCGHAPTTTSDGRWAKLSELDLPSQN